jgi:hypothetical protein
MDKTFNTYISTFYVFTKLFHGNPTFFVSCAKKTNFGVKKRLFTWHFFCLFYTSHKKSQFFHKTWSAQLECQGVSAKFLFRIFWHLQNVCVDGRSICSHVSNWISNWIFANSSKTMLWLKQRCFELTLHPKVENISVFKKPQQCPAEP